MKSFWMTWVILDDFWVILDDFWVILDDFWVIMDDFWVIMDDFWVIMDDFWVIMDEFLVSLGDFLVSLGDFLANCLQTEPQTDIVTTKACYSQAPRLVRLVFIWVSLMEIKPVTVFSAVH